MVKLLLAVVNFACDLYINLVKHFVIGNGPIVYIYAINFKLFELPDINIRLLHKDNFDIVEFFIRNTLFPT